jgi:hypothetical protein
MARQVIIGAGAARCQSSQFWGRRHCGLMGQRCTLAWQVLLKTSAPAAVGEGEGAALLRLPARLTGLRCEMGRQVNN